MSAYVECVALLTKSWVRRNIDVADVSLRRYAGFTTADDGLSEYLNSLILVLPEQRTTHFPSPARFLAYRFFQEELPGGYYGVPSS
ncbi:MAG: hypothetical protein E2O37_05530 [Proteobacteria bacterium]|nr:MAG: hypothetical protein E2O37_05530 [Pseudomonadota bacterium]